MKKLFVVASAIALFAVQACKKAEQKQVSDKDTTSVVTKDTVKVVTDTVVTVDTLNK